MHRNRIWFNSQWEASLHKVSEYVLGEFVVPALYSYAGVDSWQWASSADFYTWQHFYFGFLGEKKKKFLEKSNILPRKVKKKIAAKNMYFGSVSLDGHHTILPSRDRPYLPETGPTSLGPPPARGRVLLPQTPWRRPSLPGGSPGLTGGSPDHPGGSPGRQGAPIKMMKLMNDYWAPPPCTNKVLPT